MTKDIRNARTRLGLSQAKLSELAGVSQYRLSAFELGKLQLLDSELDKVKRVIDSTDANSVKVLRKKRVQAHSYSEISVPPERRAKAKATSGNSTYTSLLHSLESQRKGRVGGKALTGLSLFAGCGGLSLGFSWSGFRINGFVELEPGFREIYKANFPDAEELGADISAISEDEIVRWKQRFGTLDVVVGGPPCQGFSLAGKRDRHDPRNSLFRHYLRVVNIMRPKCAVMENVRLLTSMKTPQGNPVIEDIHASFRTIGYTVRHFELDAADYGVPQHRERVIFLAVRDDLEVAPEAPVQTHGASGTLFYNTQPYRTFADACSDLDYLESGHSSTLDPLHRAVHHPDHVIRWLWDVLEGESAHDNENASLRPPSGYNTTYKRQYWNEPASTVQTTFGMISGCNNVHPIATRSLTIREAARIQSFPDTFKFSGNDGTVRKCIGNAVPPLFAHAIAEQIRNTILNRVEVARL